ncbi:hypothetical protein NFI96_007326 [Prochilodus magdalenae]|nr:hypothetical protein NFI96_007326 [Prochilodus magdalenae]
MFSLLLLLLATVSCVHCVELRQPGSMVVTPGQSMSLTCEVSGYSLTDSSYCSHWIRQPAGKALEWIGFSKFLCSNSGVLTGLHSAELNQPDFLTLRPDQTLTIDCKVSYSVTTYATAWVRQHAGKAPEWIGLVYAGGDIPYKDSLRSKFTISRDTSSNTVTLRGQNLQPEDTAVYYCARASQ